MDDERGELRFNACPLLRELSPAGERGLSRSLRAGRDRFAHGPDVERPLLTARCQRYAAIVCVHAIASMR
jgi:hypothetical protein